jgi:hypothetical protein
MVSIKTAISAVAIAALMGTAAFAQGGGVVPGERVDANGMPTTRSTPEEQAETARINKQIGASNAAADAKAATDNTQYQTQQQQYQGQLKKNQAQQQGYQAQQQDYQDRTAVYNRLRDRYAAERAAYHRGKWPGSYVTWTIAERDKNLIGERVQLITGTVVGTVIDTAHVANGNVSALLVQLDSEKIVWIDVADVRYNRAGRVIMTNLDHADLRRMADERL